MEHKFSFKKLLSLLLVCAMLLSSFTFLAFADEPTNVALGSKYEIVGLTPSGSYPDTDNKELTDGTRVDGNYKDSGWVGVILTSTVRSFDVVVTLGDGETVYNIDKIVVNAGAAGCTCGVTEPDLKAFYSVDGSEWLEFGSYTPTGTDATNVNATMAVDTPVAAKYIKVNVGRAVGIGNLMWLGEIEAYGEEAPEAPKDKVSIVISGETNVIGGVDAAVEKLTDGDWALDAEAWGGNTDGVVLIQNTAATDASKREAIHLIYEFAETPEAYNTIKLGLYSSVESMIGFPTEEDVYFSNTGEDGSWVSGYDDIGYGETIPDAYTTFDGDPTKPGTVIAEVRIESPVTYKYVKFVLRYPESPFTEENGYTGGTAKPRWEFFGLTEIAFENVEVSSVITDFNASEYWESRYGRGSGSFGYTDADAYAVAWDNFIDNRFTQLAFAPVANAENVYEIVAKENGANALDFPEGGFIWLAFTNANAGSAGKAAIDLFGTMSVGETYKFTGFDFENGFVVKDATIKSWSPLPDLYWPVGEYDVSETDGNITPHHAWGYEFTLDTVNSITGNTTALFTTEAAYVAGGVGKWSTKIVLAPTDKAGVYTVDAVHKTTGKKGDADVSEGIISFDGGKLVMVVQDAGTRPEKNEDGTLKFPNWEERAAAWGLMSTVGAKVTLAGIDLAAGTHENGTITVQDAPKNVLLGVEFNKLTGTYYSYGSVATSGLELTDGYYITAENLSGALYANDNVAGFGGLKDSTLELEGALDATYSINKIVVHYANGKTGSGICEPATIKAFYKNGDGEWTQFGETFVSTETDENMGNYDFLISTVTFTGAPVDATDIRFELTPRSGKTMVFISELEAWGEEVVAEPEVPDGIVIDGALTDWEDNWTVVNGETGYWQAIPTDEAELAGYYNFQITSDENNLYIAAEIVDLTCTAFRVWFRTNPEATVYTHFYHIDANGAAGKVNTSTTANSATAITDSKAVGVFKVGEDSIIVEISIPLSEIGATDGNVEYYANTQSGSTLFYPPVAEGENGDRLANLPYKNWYVAPSEPEEPELPDVVEIKVSHVNAYNWGTFESMIITGDGKTVVDVIGQQPIWWVVYTVENVDGKYVATSYLKNSEDCYKVTVPTGGFLFYVFDANSAYAAADEEKLLGYTFVVDGLKLDGVTAIDTTLNDPKLIYAYAPGVEIPEPEPAPVTSQVVNGFNVKHYNDGSEGSSGAFIFTDAEAYAGGGNYLWWRQVAFAPSADVEGYYEVVAITNGEGGESGGHEIAEGGFIWIAFEWPELAGSSGVYALGIMNTLAVGDLVKFNGVDIANCTTTEDASVEKYVAPVDPNAPVNVALGKDYVISGCGTPYAQYQALLTDGKMINTVSYDANWFTFYCNGNDSSIINAPDHIGYVIIDLGALYDVSTVKAHIIAPGVSGIKGPKSVKAYFSADNENWSEAYVLDMSAFADPTAAFYAVAEAEAQAQYVKVEFELDGVFAFVNEIEVYGEEAATEPDPEPAYKEGLTIEIDDTLVGWIGDAKDLETIETGLTDGNWGAGDAGDWSNASGIYPFMNKVCKDGSVHPEINLIYNFGEATKVNTIELGVYSSYNVMIGYPSSLIYIYTSEDGVEWSEGTEAYLELDIPAIGNEGSVSTTLKLAETINAQYVKVALSFPDSPFEDKVVWEFVGLTEIAFDYIPVTSNVVTDFNPSGYKESFGGATGAFIYDDADIYAACGNDWWIHVAFAPVADKDGYYEVVAVRAPTTGNYLAMPEDGFIWMAWSSAGDSPETAGAYALAFMSNLKVGDIVEFVGVDFANHTTEADAYAEVWIDPDAPVNVALDKGYELSGPVDSTYSADLTDGNAYAGMSYDNKWFIFNKANSPDGIGYAIIDLGGLYDISKVAVNLINESVSGVAKPEYVKFYVSEDGETWTDLGEVALQDVQSSAYWTGIEDLTVTAQFVKLEMKIGAPFSFINEIEVYGKEAAYKLPGLPENITIWGAGADDIDVLLDGYTGVDEVNNYDGFQDKLYGFGNANLDATTYSFDIELGEDMHSFDTITLYFLDFANGGVMVPDAVKFVIDGEEYEAVITANPNGIGTIVAELPEMTEATVVSVVVDMAASPYNFGIFNMFTEIEFTAFIPAPPAEIELVVGDNNITVPKKGSAVAITEFEEDYVITVKGQWGITVMINGTVYYPNRMGVIEAQLPAGPSEVIFVNDGDEEVTFVANVAAPTVGDTPDDPIIIDELGDFTAEINDKYPQGVYYTYTATEDGTLVITIKSESGWTYTVNNITAGKYGDMHWSDDEELVISEILEVKAGDEIQIVVNTYDPENPWGLTVGSVEFSVAYDNGEDTVEIALGDVNMDGKIDQYDYVLVKRAYFNTYTLSEAQAAVADATGDGKVDTYDYLLIARHYFKTFEIKGTVEVPADAVPQK
ncbi:MAG: hypothetical protein J6Q72_01535 [Clostridia bacterium]|nr:hypothetical protein [Clostridia bacterium]